MKNALPLLLLASVFVPTSAFAQAACDAGVPVTIRLQSDLSATVPSASVGIYAVIENTSAEAISNAAIAVDVVQKSTGMIVDRFVVSQRVSVFGKGNAKIGFVWQAPPAARDGIYTVKASFAPQDAPRAAAFSHTLYPSASLDIELSGGADSGIEIESLALNGQAYESGSLARLAVNRTLAIANIANPSGVPYIGTIAWRAYAPDAKLTDTPIDEHTAPVDLHPGTRAAASYEVASADGSYYIEGALYGVRGSAYFDMLLDRSGSSFAWSACGAGGSMQRALDLRLFGAVVALLLGAAVLFYQRRRA